METKWTPYYRTILLGLCLLFYFPFLGAVHLFDWDEINFAESAREMIVTGNYFRVMIDYKPFWEKPPFFFWLQVISMKIFGINEFAARLPNAVFGTLTILTLYQTGTKLLNKTFGFIWGFLYLISFLPFFYFKSGIIDPVFNYFIFLSMLLLLKAYHTSKGSWWIIALAGMVNGLAVLTKGPVGFLLLALTYLVIWITGRFKQILSPGHIFIFITGVFITSSLWYVPEILMNGIWFIREFVLYQIDLFRNPVAGHQQPFFYHFLVVFIGCFPISILAIPAMKRRFLVDNREQGETKMVSVYRNWNLVLLSVVLVLFSIVKTKIVHYSSMSYLPLSFLAAGYVYNLVQQRITLKKWMLILLGTMGVIFALIMISIPLLAMNKELLLPYLKDPFARAAFSQPVKWIGIEWMVGLFFLVGLLAFLVMATKGQVFKGIVTYGMIALIVLTVYLKLVIPKIEAYSQGGLIEFYESIRGEDVYVVPVSFKTYAHYFYFRQPLYDDIPGNIDKQEWMTLGPVNKPVYIIVKNTEKYVKDLPDVKLITPLGGYMVYRREAVAD